MFGIDSVVLGAALKKYWPYAAGLAAIALVLSLGYCAVKKIGSQGEVIKQQGREIETQIDLGEANGNAADARVNDAVKAERQTRELSDALNATNDPDRQRALRGCVILRQQGRDTSRIPACGGH